jgi:predicted metal-dependent hydrolase
MKTSILAFSDFEITLLRKKIKNINLRIDQEGNVKVTAPLRIPVQEIQTFINTKYTWILQHRQRLLARPVRKKVQFQPGELHQFLGNLYPFIIHETTEKSKIKLENGQIACYLKTNISVLQQQALLQHWHRQEMNCLVPKLIQKWQPIIGVQIAEWGVKMMKTRWGSCNTLEKRIWLNLLLIHEPIQCLEYVVVHELVHLLEPSHNARFHALMTQFMPDWKVYKNLLRDVSTR